MNRKLFNTRIFNIDIYKLRSSNFYKNMISQRDKVYLKLKNFLISEKNCSCILCGSKKKFTYLKWKKYLLINCLNCEAIYPNINFKKFSPEYFHSNNVKRKINKNEMLKTFNYRLNNFASERIEYIKSNISLNKKDTILDYGCGFGSFLYALKKNKIQSKGIDFDNDSINFCKSKNLNVSSNSLTNEKDRSIKIITMFDVIEHLVDPVDFLKIANKKLKKNGFMLLFTPNIHSLSGKLMGPKHNMFAVFNHLCFYNENSLKYLAKKTGFKIQRIDYFGLDIKDYFQMIESKTNGIKFNKILNEFSNLTQSILDENSASNSMRIILKKI
tara:strand:- start:2283 stop:3266 length:984 start_codon:yes stop_codon:yes gene_type:complete